MSQLDIDPEGLDSSGSQIEGVAERFFSALEQFSAKIEGFSDASGGDEIGGLIGMAHQEVFAAAQECFTEAAQSIADAGADLRDFAKQHTDVDDEIAAIFTQLGSDLGGGA